MDRCILLSLILLILYVPERTASIQCYECNYDGVGSRNDCFTSPASTSTVSCDLCMTAVTVGGKPADNQELCKPPNEPCTNTSQKYHSYCEHGVCCKLHNDEFCACNDTRYTGMRCDELVPRDMSISGSRIYKLSRGCAETPMNCCKSSVNVKDRTEILCTSTCDSDLCNNDTSPDLNKLPKCSEPSVGIGCYQCSYNGTGSRDCVTSPVNTTRCNDSCAVIAELHASTRKVRTLVRGCSDKPANCCKSAGGGDTGFIECTSTCDNDLCNSEPYGPSSDLNKLPRCTTSGNNTHMMCNLCQTPAGSCVNDPNSPTVDQIFCNKTSHYCTVKNVSSVAEPSIIQSFQRACNAKDSEPYGETIDSGRRTWICHCSEDYCNDNTGLSSEPECHPTDPVTESSVSRAVKDVSDGFLRTLLLLSFGASCLYLRS